MKMRSLEPLIQYGASQVKSLLANAGDVRDSGSIPGWEDPLEEEMATHSSILAWRIPWTEGVWWAMIHGVTKGQKQLKRRSTAHSNPE